MVVEYGEQALLGIQIGETELDLSEDYVIGVHLSETLTQMVPTARIDFRDKKYKILESLGLVPQDKIKMQFGSSYNNSHYLEFDYFSTKNVEFQSPEAAILPVNLMFSGWELFFKETYRRAWEADSASNVVSDIVAEGGWEPDVENSTDNANYIQAHLTNAQMIKRMSMKAKNAWGDEGYVYGLRSDGTFLFKSYKALNKNNKNVISFELSPVNRDNRSNLNRIYNWGLKSTPRFTAIRGGYGVQRQGFDLATKAYKEEQFDLTDTNYQPLASQSFISNDEMGEFRDSYSFSWDTSKQLACSTAIRAVSNLIQLEIATSFNQEIKLGNLADISIVGIMDRGNEAETLASLSGKWLISEINTYFTAKSNYPLSKLTLIRDGIDKNR